MDYVLKMLDSEMHAGAIPVFVDVNPDIMNIEPDFAEKSRKITSKTNYYNLIVGASS